MELLQQRILSDGKVKPGGILKVDGFLNHRIDTQLLYEMAMEFKRLYEGQGINKILTIEASGIAAAAMTGFVMGCPMVFAKKSKSRYRAGTDHVLSPMEGKRYLFDYFIL